jgi:hypothetical protein
MEEKPSKKETPSGKSKCHGNKRIKGLIPPSPRPSQQNQGILRELA